MAPAEDTAVSAEILPRIVVHPPMENKHLAMEKLGPTYLTNHPTDHLQYSNNIVAKTDPTAPRTIVIIVDKIRVKTGLLFTKSKI